MVVPARVAAVPIRVAGLAEPILAMSVYFHDGMGLRGANASLLASVMRLVLGISNACIIAGDFNVQPSEVREALRVNGSNMAVVAPSEPTCVLSNSASVLDFFIVTLALASRVKACNVCRNTMSVPHSPVLLSLQFRVAMQTNGDMSTAGAEHPSRIAFRTSTEARSSMASGAR
jgi:hypothetical protein